MQLILCKKSSFTIINEQFFCNNNFDTVMRCSKKKFSQDVAVNVEASAVINIIIQWHLYLIKSILILLVTFILLFVVKKYNNR